ncbi:uncharacterized protein LOC132729341 isoform X3 [Ruditapes philippinarum]|uniref:uncharacterized protein LOC132729341 isoform X3 n=1 Tax=Ruditapes philippinarum TaxID=129788 RepID=UPI00295AFD82|nr:uncharacterized protein LOC132729341 isoform X3 [Ruditapes philippinarum]
MRILIFSISICLLLLLVGLETTESLNSDAVNLSVNKPSKQISTWNSQRRFPSNLGNDGDANSDMYNDRCLHTKKHMSRWWVVDLLDVYSINTVKMTNRADCCADRAENVKVTVAVKYGEWTVVASKEGPLGASATLTFDPVEARYVRLTLRDKETWFHLCEVEVYGSNSDNLTLDKPSNMIIWGELETWGAPDKRNDGDTDSDMYNDSCFSTKTQMSPWLEVDLVDVYSINTVKMTNTADCCAERAENVEVSVAVEYGEWTVVASKEGPLGASATLTFDPVEARYVRLTLRDKETWFHLCEVEVYGSTSDNLALEKPSNTSSIGGEMDNWDADKGNDGDADSNMYNDSCFSTKKQMSPWWEVDLLDVYSINTVKMTNTADCCASDNLALDKPSNMSSIWGEMDNWDADKVHRAENIEISVAKEYGKWRVVLFQRGSINPFTSLTIYVVEARYVRVTLRDIETWMHLCEVEVYGYTI